MTLARRVALTAALVATCAATAATAAASASAAQTSPPAPRMHFDKQLIVRSACFSVVNPQGTQSVLYGQWFIDGTYSKKTPTIVLVHGLASSTKNWDFSKTWSVPAAAGR